MGIVNYKKGVYLKERTYILDKNLTKEQQKLIDLRFQYWKDYASRDGNSLPSCFFEHKKMSEKEFKLLLLEEDFSINMNPELKKWEKNINAIESDQFFYIDLPKAISNKSDEEPLFTNFLIPFAKLAIGRIKKEKNIEKNLFYTEEILLQFVQKLAEQMFNISMRTLILELNIYKEQFGIENATKNFNEKLANRDFFLAILQKYPVLFRQISITVDNWIENTFDFFSRLEKDTELLSEKFFKREKLGGLLKIYGESDSHNGGKAVLILEFEDGKKVVYKPHSMEAENKFNNILGYLNEKSEKQLFYLPNILFEKDYSWMEFVENSHCTDYKEFSMYYYRMGCLLAVLNTFRVLDIHFENLIAHRDYPVLVDNEVLFANEREFSYSTTASGMLEQKLLHSVKNVGILPSFSRGIDISAIGSIDEQKIPYKMATMRKDKNDLWTIEYDYGTIKRAHNVPYLKDDDTIINSNLFLGDIEEGFKYVYELINNAKKEELLEQLKQFGATKVRYIARPTQTYADLLKISNHPDFLRSALDREMLFDRLWKFDDEDINFPITSEQSDLLRGDIPYFLMDPVEKDLIHTSTTIKDYFDVDAIEKVKKYLFETMGEDDMNFQLKIIDFSFVGKKNRSNQVTMPKFKLMDFDEEEIYNLNNRMIKVAEEIGQKLISEAFIGPQEDISWLTASLFGEAEDTLGILPIGLSLYDGVSGIALFFMQLYNITGKDVYFSVVEKCYHSIKLEVEEIQQITHEVEKSSSGAYEGAASLIYVLLLMEKVLPNKKNEIDNMKNLLIEEIESQIENDKSFDVMNGSAGTILSLLALYKETKNESVLFLAKRAGNYLLSQAKVETEMLMWQPEVASNPLAGYSHGASGISYALMLLGKETGESQYFEAAEYALNYERSLFIAEKGNWADKREFEGTEYSDLNDLPVAWCHGAPGVLLSRIKMLDICKEEQKDKLKKEAKTALETTLREGLGKNYSLCHGDLGNLMILKTVADINNDHSLNNKIYSYLNYILNDLENQNWKCGLGFIENKEIPGLMLGLAGIGYGLLFLMKSDLVPNILLTEIKYPAGGKIDVKDEEKDTVYSATD